MVRLQVLSVALILGFSSVTMAEPFGPRLAVSANGAKMTGGVGDFVDLGFGVGVSGGYEFRYGAWSLTPELSVRYSRFSSTQTSAMQGSVWILGVLPGARLQYRAGLLEPWAALHAGLDHGGASDGESRNVVGTEVGGGLDFALGTASVGPFIDYSWPIDTQDQWVSFGFAGSVRF